MRVILKVVCILCVSFTLCFYSMGCEATPIESRTYNEIKGTYSLVKYYSKLDNKTQDLLGNFEYFYLVVRESAMATVIYKDAYGNPYFAHEYGISFKYRSGSTEEINEIKIRFEMPFSTRVDGMYVNYLTVSPNDSLACVKTDYHVSSEKKTKQHHAVYMSLKHVDNDITYGYIERVTGQTIDNVLSPYIH